MRRNSPARNRQRRQDRCAPVCEPVEPRVLLSTYMVTNTGDSGAGSLRAGMVFANENAGATPTTIDFNIPGDGVQTIEPLSPLPEVGNVLIDGYSQPGAMPNTLGTGDNAVLKIELDGSSAGNSPGLHLTNGAEVRGLVINRFAGQPAILADPRAPFGPGFEALVTIYGNYIGTDATGNSDFAGDNAEGIKVTGDCLIGGSDLTARNIVSGNAGDGIVLAGGGPNLPPDQTQDNYIGINSAGTSALPNGKNGINVTGVSENISDNVISGNTMAGIAVSSNNQIKLNSIGTDAKGTSAVPNGNNGITIGGGTMNLVANNVIAFNNGAGVVILGAGPFLGAFNVISQNAIHDNTALGIDLGGDGVTPNTPDGPRQGPNHLLNYPVLTYAASGVGGTIITGTLHDLPSVSPSEFLIEFFLNPKADPSGHGQGQTFLGSFFVPVNAAGDASFTFQTPDVLTQGGFLSATATEAHLSFPGFVPEEMETSEFSADIKVGVMGDLNNDGRVDFGDLAILARHFGQSGTPDQGDINGDGKINFDDLVLLARNYGRSISGGQAIANTEPLLSAGAQATTLSDHRRLNRRPHAFSKQF